MTIAETAFSQLIAIAGRQRPDFVHINTAAPALQTRFYAGEAAAAVLAAGATIAADLWQMRGGPSQQVNVDTREAAASLISFSYQKFDDAEKAVQMRRPGAAPRTGASGFFPTRDGRQIYLHPSFPDSAAGLMHLLDCPDEREAVAASVADWDALALEQAIAKAGVCGAMVRTPEEWDSSEQGRLLVHRPAVEVTKIADSSPEPLPEDGDMPLSGIRVLDLTRVLAGPTCARTLAQYGADAMRIGSADLPSVPFFVTDTGHGKLSAFVELKTTEGRKLLNELVRASDVFSQGYRSGSLEQLGFGPTELAQLRPGIIYTSINCYGHEGPWRQRPGWEQLAQTVTGMAHLHGGNAGPKLQPAAVTDYTTGYLAAFGSMIALQQRALYGGSYLVRVSLSQTGMWIRSLGMAESLNRVEPLSDREIASFTIGSETGFGPMTHLRPAVQLSATPTCWKRGVVPLGTHSPEWPQQ